MAVLVMPNTESITRSFFIWTIPVYFVFGLSRMSPERIKIDSNSPGVCFVIAMSKIQDNRVPGRSCLGSDGKRSWGHHFDKTGEIGFLRRSAMVTDTLRRPMLRE